MLRAAAEEDQTYKRGSVQTPSMPSHMQNANPQVDSIYTCRNRDVINSQISTAARLLLHLIMMVQSVNVK